MAMRRDRRLIQHITDPQFYPRGNGHNSVCCRCWGISGPLSSFRLNQYPDELYEKIPGTYHWYQRLDPIDHKIRSFKIKFIRSCYQCIMQEMINKERLRLLWKRAHVTTELRRLGVAIPG